MLRAAGSQVTKRWAESAKGAYAREWVYIARRDNEGFQRTGIPNN
jgi:hypothetical protein